MRNLLLLTLSLVLFSCSKDNIALNEFNRDLEIQTDDPINEYESPYVYQNYIYSGKWRKHEGTLSSWMPCEPCKTQDSLVDAGYYIDVLNPHGPETDINIAYIFENKTDLKFTFTPYFGFGSYDDDPFGEILWYMCGRCPDMRIFDTRYYTYCPNLTANRRKYGNFVPAKAITLPNNRGDNLMVYQTYLLPYRTPEFPQVDNPMSFDFNSDNIATTFERDILGKLGKLYFINFKVEDLKGYQQIASSTVKLDFPSHTLSNDWESLPYTDAYFNEKMYYHKTTREICIAITDQSRYTGSSRFTYNGRNYMVSVKSNRDSIMITLE